MAGFFPTNIYWNYWAYEVIIDNGIIAEDDLNYEIIESPEAIRTFKTFDLKNRSGVYIKFDSKEVPDPIL